MTYQWKMSWKMSSCLTRLWCFTINGSYITHLFMSTLVTFSLVIYPHSRPSIHYVCLYITMTNFLCTRRSICTLYWWLFHLYFSRHPFIYLCPISITLIYYDWTLPLLSWTSIQLFTFNIILIYYDSLSSTSICLCLVKPIPPWSSYLFIYSFTCSLACMFANIINKICICNWVKKCSHCPLISLL